MHIREKPGHSLASFSGVWLRIGLQSFGGGLATLAAIRRAAVDQERWISEDEFTEMWALVQLAPGINLIALTILIGTKVHGGRGAAAAMAGLLLPTGIITAIMTAGYVAWNRSPVLNAAVQGAVPAVVGLGLVTTARTLLPVLRASRSRGRISLLIVLGAVTAAGAATFALIAPVWAILLTTSTLVALDNSRTSVARS